MLIRILRKYKVGKNYEGIILEYGKRYLEDKSQEVRSAACELMAAMAEFIGVATVM